MPDEPNKSKNSVVIVVLLLLVCAVVAGWLFFKGKATNAPPIAGLRLESLDETNRIATISDKGSQDPDGELRSWRIGWGDGKEDNLPSTEQKAAHTYGSEGEYTISVWCVDNKGATSSVPATTNITLDFAKRQKALEQAQMAKRQEEAKLEADRLKAEQAKKEAERLAQEKQKEMAAEQARKAKEQEELAAKRKAEAEAELARQQREEAAKAATPAPPAPLAAGLAENPLFHNIIFTPRGYTLGQFQISKEKAEAVLPSGKVPVVLVIRCVNFPNTPIPTSDWHIDGKDVQVRAGRIRASLAPGRHDVMAILTRSAGSGPTELKAEVTVGTNGDCVVEPRN